MAMLVIPPVNTMIARTQPSGFRAVLQLSAEDVDCAVEPVATTCAVSNSFLAVSERRSVPDLCLFWRQPTHLVTVRETRLE